MQKQKLWLIPVTVVVLGVGVYFSRSDGTAPPQAQTLLASKVSGLSCYPQRYGKPEQLNKFPFGGVVYYEVHASPKNSVPDSLVEVLYFNTSQKGCKWLNRESQVGSRLLYMPKPVALHFAKLQYHPPFDRCLKQNAKKTNHKQHCIKVFEADINVPTELMSAEHSFLYPEDVEVLNQLGIRTDKALVITKPSELGEARRKQLEQP